MWLDWFQELADKRAGIGIETVSWVYPFFIKWELNIPK